MDIHLRLELEYSIQSKTEAKETWYNSFGSEEYHMDFNVQTAFVNAYYDFYTGTPFTPYIGGGVGLAFIDAKGGVDLYGYGLSTGSKNNTNFAWNIGVGLGVELTDNITLDGGYRFVSLGKAKTGTGYADLGGGYIVGVSGKSKNIYLHQVYLGVRYTF